MASRQALSQALIIVQVTHSSSSCNQCKKHVTLWSSNVQAKQAPSHAPFIVPCRLYLSHADGQGPKANEEREQTLNQLLTEMDGFTPDVGVVFIGATNRCGGVVRGGRGEATAQYARKVRER